MQIAARTAAWAKSGYTALDYVQDGIIAMWDGIENVGIKSHSDNTTTWNDISGNSHDMLIQSSSRGSWDADGYRFDGYYAYYNSDLDTNFMKQASTCETVYSVMSGCGVNYRGLFGGRNLESNSNCFLCGLNFYTGASGWSFGGIEDTSPNAIQLSKHVNLSDGVVVGRINSYALTLDRARIHVVLNGTQEASESNPMNWWSGNTHGWMIGMAFGNGMVNNGYNGSDRAAKAKILCHRIYNRVLSNEEIAANYAIDKARFNLPDATT